MKPRFQAILTVLLTASMLGMVAMPLIDTMHVAGAWQPLDDINVAPINPQPTASRVIANTTLASAAWMGAGGYQDGDDLTVNAGGTFTFDLAWAGSDGSRDTNAIVINAGGIVYIEAGVRLDINTGTAITVEEGGQLLSLGSASSRVSIVGESTTSASHKIESGGKTYCAFTDISNFYMVDVNGGQLELVNNTIDIVQWPLYSSSAGGVITVINSTIEQSTASRYCFATSSAYGKITAINCAFISLTDNYLGTASKGIQITFAGCTYQGVPIAPDDFPHTSQDIDIRIYEASTVTSNIADVHWSLSHPLMDSTGMVYDSDNYMRVPGYIAYGQGNTTIYTLNKTAYWESGLAVASRTWFNVSVGDDATTNEWNITASAWGYQTNSTEVYSGTNATVNLTAISTAAIVPPGLEGDTGIFTYSDGTYITLQGNYTWGADAFISSSITFNDDIDGVYCNATLLDGTGATVYYFGNATYDFLDGISASTSTIFGIGLSVDTSFFTNGTYAVMITIEHPTIESNSVSGQFNIMATLIPGLRNDAFIGTYDTLGDFRTNYTWGEIIEAIGEVTFTYSTTATVNITVRDAIGATVLYLGQANESYTAGVAIQLATTMGASVTVNTSLLGNESYVVVVKLTDANITTTYIYGGFAVLPAIIPGLDDAIYLLLSGSAMGIPRGNYTVGETIYCAGGIETTYNLALVDVRMAVYINDGINTYVAWPDNDTFSFTAGTTYTPTDIHGVQPSFSTSGWTVGEYTVIWNFTHADLDTINIYSDFTLGYLGTAFLNASVYSSNLTYPANLTNRFDWNAIAYFNGTIGTTYDTSSAVINITIGNVTTWLETLWNGTHSFIGGTNESLTDICGDILNYTCDTEGDWRIIITVSHASLLNATTITEGFTVANCTDYINNSYLSGVRFLLPAFFEYRNRPNRVVEFRDRSKEFNGVTVVKVIWSFGDGQNEVGMDVDHTYQLPGIYNATATVWFSDGTIQMYSSQVEVTTEIISWWAYAIFSALVMCGILAVGVYASRNKSKRLLAAMWGLLGLFIAITVIIMQFAVE